MHGLCLAQSLFKGLVWGRLWARSAPAARGRAARRRRSKRGVYFPLPRRAPPGRRCPATALLRLPPCRTKVIYTETLSNPTLVVADIPALAQLAHSRVR